VGGAVKAGLALANGKLYFGDYDGRMHAIRQADGSRVWSVGTSGARFGLSAGSFYSTPAVAYGRVYAGNTDGRIYSFASDNGKLAWAKRTGGYVYASPAVAQVPGGKPTVYAGSYDGRFYALDARTGRVRWSHNAKGRISGGATVIGDIVYFSNLGKKSTVGLGARTGRKVYSIRRGAFNPVVSDGERIYLTGYSSLYAFKPR
jgi:outer membrane protein assembly factor BamB